MRRPPMASRALVWLSTMGVFILACAVSVPPSGGPEDRTPPSIAGSVPSADSAGVDPGTSIAITFSEPMTQTGIERTMKFSPQIEYGRISWKKQTLIITPAQPLHPDTTYVVTLGGGYRDAHGVQSVEHFKLAFATAAVLDTARIEGTVSFRREPTPTAIVRCFRLPRDSGFTVEASKPDRESVTDGTGNYSLQYLSARGDSFLVWAFQDQNKNDRYDPANEYGMAFSDTIVLTATNPVFAATDIAIIDPNEPGSVKGSVVNASGIDTVDVTVSLAAAADTVRARYVTTAAAGVGTYTFSTVHPGTYALSAFVDIRADSLCGSYPCGIDSTDSCAEPCGTGVDSVVVHPGEAVVVPTITLPAPAEEDR